MDIDEDEDFGFSSSDEQQLVNLTSTKQSDMLKYISRTTPGARKFTPRWTRPTRSTHTLVKDALSSWVYPTNVPVRDYQRNIAERALLSNVLCALPTGLGKTMIAAVVMLNWYRWTASAKIVFMAPTRPLVTQQAEACYNLVGIPRHDTAIFVGGLASPTVRDEVWRHRRVVFATPQTVENDLKRGSLDPKDVVLVVVDEAHRATGEYAYTKVIEFITRFNCSLRVLALSATPGSSVGAVQQVISNLAISNTEIRTESSEDVVDYVQTTDVEHLPADLTGEGLELLDLYCEILAPLLKELNNMSVYHVRDPHYVSAFGLTNAFQLFMVSPAAQNYGLVNKARAVFAVLSSLAHASSLLKYHGIRPFYDYISDWHIEQTTKPGTEKPKQPGKYASMVISNSKFKQLIKRADEIVAADGFVSHEKINIVVATLVEYFERQDVAAANSKVIIFCQYRSSGAEIERVLQALPSVKAHLFFGQARSKRADGDEKAEKGGMPQKEQQRILDEFKAGTYNTLIATSIGEEGLDIGQVDMIICFDASSSPVRVLQRMGRTGRFRKGRIVAVLTERERNKWDDAMMKYAAIQAAISRESSFEFAECNRILPDDVTPELVLKQIDIPAENAAPAEVMTGTAAKRKSKKKFSMPDDVETKFTTAGKLHKRTATSDTRDQENIDPNRRKKQAMVYTSMTKFIEPDFGLLTCSQQRDLKDRYGSVYGDSFRTQAIEYDPVASVRNTGTKVGNSERTTRLADFVSSIDTATVNRVTSGAVPGPWDVRTVVIGDFAPPRQKSVNVTLDIKFDSITQDTIDSSDESMADVSDLLRYRK
ncbi:P-loop containing nucleoside triphosphate hydrolase protein [Lipomyces arxii]|uniref:P-loop containing nucleoside triphosphate hydrolase protein n=1 Tax=Lipomyces arxii TaxID=56418 RepID=UPI0034CDC5D9